MHAKQRANNHYDIILTYKCLILINIEMKKFSVILMVLTIMSVMSCENSKKSEAAVDKAATESSVTAEPKKSKKVIVARVTVKEGQEAAFIAVGNVLVEATRKEPGCLFYTLYQSTTDSKTFVFYEEYKDQAAFDSHSNSDHFKVFAEALGDILDGDLVVDQF